MNLVDHNKNQKFNVLFAIFYFLVSYVPLSFSLWTTKIVTLEERKRQMSKILKIISIQNEKNDKKSNCQIKYQKLKCWNIKIKYWKIQIVKWKIKN